MRPAGTKNVLHSSGEERWYTPPLVIKLARRVLGSIDLDPASDAFGNSRVGASSYYSKGVRGGGLAQPWYGKIFVNPPGGVVPDPKGGKREVSQARLFWDRLEAQRSNPAFVHAIYVAFSIEQLVRTQSHGEPSWGAPYFPFVIPSARLRYTRPDGTEAEQPTHGCAVVYVPGSKDHTPLFASAFKRIGAVCIPHGWPGRQ